MIDLAKLDRAMLPHLVRVASVQDGQIIQAGADRGMLPSYGQGEPRNEWLRYRAACARAEARLHPQLAKWLEHRAHAADAEAAAIERGR